MAEQAGELEGRLEQPAEGASLAAHVPAVEAYDFDLHHSIIRRLAFPQHELPERQDSTLPALLPLCHFGRVGRFLPRLEVTTATHECSS